MSIVFIGSYALWNLRIPNLPKRKTLDIDIISPISDALKFANLFFYRNVKCFMIKKDLQVFVNKENPDGTKLENNTPYSGSNKLIYDYVLSNYDKKDNYCYYPTLDLLYTLKMSHRFKKTNKTEFNKTMTDILYMRKNGASISDSKLVEIYNLRQHEILNYKHPNLMQKKDAFFTDDVGYIYDHDTIHEAVKNMEKPAYQYYKPESNEVFCSKELFDSCDEKIKLYGVYEESCVLALERAIIPFSITDEDMIKNRFEYALQKVCTSITSGWFRDYAYENYNNVLNMFNMEFYHNFNKGLKSGVVKKV